MAGEGILIDNFECGSTIRLTVTTASTTGTFTAVADVQGSDMLIYNEGSSIAYMAVSNSTVGTIAATVPNGTAGGGKTPIPPGAIMTLKKGCGDDTVTFITASGTTNIDVTAGVGS